MGVSPKELHRTTLRDRASLLPSPQRLKPIPSATQLLLTVRAGLIHGDTTVALNNGHPHE